MTSLADDFDVYGAVARQAALFKVSVEPLMKLTRPMPSRFLISMWRANLPPVEFASRILTQCDVVENRSRSFRDRAIRLHDLFSSQFVHYHSIQEAKRWAGVSGFERIEDLPYHADNGQRAEIGDVLDKYRGVCRPSFGMRCEARRPPAEIPA